MQAEVTFPRPAGAIDANSQEPPKVAASPAGPRRRPFIHGPWFKLLALGAPVLLIGILALLVQRTTSRGFDFDDAIRTVREAKQVDAQWSLNLLSATSGLVADYDAVAALLPEVERLGNRVHATAEVLGEGDDASGSAVLAPVSEYRQLAQRKIELVERAKSHHSILINSARYLPVANADLHEAAVTSGLGAAELSRLTANANVLLADTMSYVLVPDTWLEKRIQDGITAADRVAPTMPPAVGERLRAVAAHTRVLLDARQAVVRVTEQLQALAMPAALDAIGDGYAKAQQTAQQRQQRDKTMLAVYCAVLLALLALAGRSLYKSYAALAAMNRSLADNNQTLQTANEEAQTMLLQSAKMSAIGEMVAGVAHEINTPLAYVKATFEVFREQLTQAHEQAVDDASFGRVLAGKEVESTQASADDRGMLDEMLLLLDDAMHGIHQISRLVMNLKNFSRIDRAMFDNFSVEEGLDSTLDIAHHMLKHSVEVNKEYGAVPKITCSPSQINQVFLNVITNAVQAMPKRDRKGVITLRTRMEGTDSVRIDIQDDGAGIPAHVLPRIFEPFFTTKPVGEGTGAGLAICYRIVQSHGGRILVNSEAGVGTTFSIVLPVQHVDSTTNSPKVFAHA